MTARVLTKNLAEHVYEPQTLTMSSKEYLVKGIFRGDQSGKLSTTKYTEAWINKYFENPLVAFQTSYVDKFTKAAGPNRNRDDLVIDGGYSNVVKGRVIHILS